MAGSSKDLERAYELKRLFDEQLDKVDPKLSHHERMQRAASLMDRVAGREWRGEIQLPGVDLVEIEIVGSGPRAKDPKSFYDRVHRKMLDEGLDYKDMDTLDTDTDRAKRTSIKDIIMCQLDRILTSIFGE